jgi:hypothetical protein
LGDGKIFQITLKDYDQYLAEKQAIASKRQVFLEGEGMTPEIYETVCRFIVSKYPSPVKPPHTLYNIAMQIQEDLAIHRLSDATDWLGAAHICFPSGWNPAEKVGRPLEVIHAPIPGMNLGTSRKLVETMIFHGPFDRYVWSPVYEERLDFHPDMPKKPFDPDNPVLFIKVERQITYGFPEHLAALFVLRQFLIPENELDKPALYKSLAAMTPDQKAYKSVSEDLIEYLRRQTHG